jgi:hypothetical protein
VSAIVKVSTELGGVVRELCGRNETLRKFPQPKSPKSLSVILARQAASTGTSCYPGSHNSPPSPEHESLCPGLTWEVSQVGRNQDRNWSSLLSSPGKKPCIPGQELTSTVDRSVQVRVSHEQDDGCRVGTVLSAADGLLLVLSSLWLRLQITITIR